MKKHKVVLTFDSKLEKDYFLGQLSDGWGENSVSLSCPKGVKLKAAQEIHVDPTICDNWEHHLQMCVKYPRVDVNLNEVEAALKKIEEERL